MSQLNMFAPASLNVPWRAGPQPMARFTSEPVGDAIGCVWPRPPTKRQPVSWLWFVALAKLARTRAGGEYWAADGDIIAEGVVVDELTAEQNVLRVLASLQGDA